MNAIQSTLATFTPQFSAILKYLADANAFTASAALALIVPSHLFIKKVEKNCKPFIGLLDWIGQSGTSTNIIL